MRKKDSSPSKRCNPRKQPMAAGMHVALPPSIPSSAPVTAVAGAGSGRRIAANHVGGTYGSRSSSSSRSYAAMRVLAEAAAAALAPTPTLATVAPVTAAAGACHRLAALYRGYLFGSGNSSSSRSHAAMYAHGAAAAPPPTYASMQAPRPLPLFPPSQSPSESQKIGRDDAAVLEAAGNKDEHKDGSASSLPATRQRTASAVQTASSIVPPTPMLRMLPPAPGVPSGESSAGPLLSSLVSLVAPAVTIVPHSLSSSVPGASSSSRSDLLSAASSSSTRLSPAVAAKTGYAPRWCGDFAKVPSAVITKIGKYLQGPQYNSFQKTGVVPKREAGMVVLSNSAFASVPVECEYISPIANKPGFDMPSNRQSFSLATPTITVPAILRLLDREVPWNITMLTIILWSGTLAKNLHYLPIILPQIVAALRHVKHIVLVIDRVQFVFSVGIAPGKRSPVELGIENLELAQSIFTSFSRVPGGYSTKPLFEFCEDLLREFPIVGLHSRGLHSITMELQLIIKDHLSFLQKIASDPGNLFYSRLKLSATIYPDFMSMPENAGLLPFFSYVQVYIRTVPAELVSIDFSNFDRMITATVTNLGNTRVGSTILPQEKKILEKVTLDIKNHVGGLTFPYSKAYTRLREFHLQNLPAGEFPIRFDSKVFPALERISCIDVPASCTLDLSGITNPGLSLGLRKCDGTLRLPTVELGRLDISDVSLSHATIRAALPTVRDLYFIAVSSSSINRLFDILRGSVPVAGPSAAAAGAGAGAGGCSAAGAGADSKVSLTSTFLEQLVLVCPKHGTDEIRMGAFLHLQSLVLYNTSVVLDGCNLPQLDSLVLIECDVRITGNFPCLTALKARGVHGSTHIECIAPMLTELEFTEVTDARNVAIGPKVFPVLRSLHISTFEGFPHRVNPLPTFEPRITPDWSGRITVRLAVPSVFLPDLDAPVDLVKTALPDCLLNSFVLD